MGLETRAISLSIFFPADAINVSVGIEVWRALTIITTAIKNHRAFADAFAVTPAIMDGHLIGESGLANKPLVSIRDYFSLDFGTWSHATGDKRE